MTSVARRYAKDLRTTPAPDALRAPVVLMVSGGADSTALLLLACTSTLDIADGRGEAHIARERLHVLHVNHGLRGLDAEEDEEFVRGLADRWGVPVTVRSVDVPALADARPGESFEQVAREVRYAEAAALADRLCEEWGTPRSAARIVTAHTADDRAETFFMNAVRGTGARGLSSIPRVRGRIVRPLLELRHRDLCDLLRMHGIVWREDETNQDVRYLRNHVRHRLLPVAAEENPRVVEAVASTVEIVSDEDAYLTSVAMRAYREVTRTSEEGLRVLDANRLAAMDVAIARRVARSALLDVAPTMRLEAQHVNALLELVAAGEGSFTAPLGVDVSVQYGTLRIKGRDAEKAFAGWLEVPGALDLGDGRSLVASLVPVAPADNAPALARAHGLEHEGLSVMLDAEACGVAPEGGRLWVDAPKAGDVLCPLGMHGQSKRVSELLAEARVPARERSRVPMVRTGPTGAAVWVVGVRADERARVTPGTRAVALLTLVDERGR